MLKEKISITTVSSKVVVHFVPLNTFLELHCKICRTYMLDPMRFETCHPLHSICTKCALQLSLFPIVKCPSCRTEGKPADLIRCSESILYTTVVMKSPLCGCEFLGADLYSHLKVCKLCMTGVDKWVPTCDGIKHIATARVPQHFYIPRHLHREYLFRFNPPAIEHHPGQFTRPGFGTDHDITEEQEEQQRAPLRVFQSNADVVPLRLRWAMQSQYKLFGNTKCFVSGCSQLPRPLECTCCMSLYHTSCIGFCFHHSPHSSHADLMREIVNAE